MSELEPSVTKRKVIDTVSTLDAAVKDTLPLSRATKRRRVSPPISTPALISILTLNNRLKRPKYRSITPSPSYTPHSLSDLVARISTYSLTTYSPGKPISLSPLSCSLLGWKNAGKERLECISCSRGFIISPPSTGGWNSSVGKKLTSKWESELRESHEKSCAWRVRGCSRSLYKVKIDSRSEMLSDLRKKAIQLEQVGLGEMRINLGGLTEKDGKALLEVVMSYKEPQQDGTTEITPTQPLSLPSLSLALFGWNLFSVSPSPILTCLLCTRKVSTQSYSTSATSKVFDLASQHQAFCPYINSSTSSLSSPSSSSSSSVLLSPESIKGWETRLKVLLNKNTHGKGSSWSSGEKLKVGTKELMTYVRELLGPKVKK